MTKRISVQSAKAKGRVRARVCRRCRQDYQPSKPLQKICDTCRVICSTCSTPLTEESWDLTGFKLRKQSRCKSCVAAGVKKTKGNAGFCQTTYDLKRNYGLTVEERDNLFSNGCEICGSKEKLCVDHEHTTGVVRGCLCSRCNTGLGMFNDDREKLKSAERYLRIFEEK